MPTVRFAHFFSNNYANKINFLLCDIFFYLLNIVGRINYKIIGNIPDCNRKFHVFAAKHQSTMETFLIHRLLQAPAFVVKRTLLRVPFFGKIIQYYGSFGITREQNFVAARKLFSGIKNAQKLNNKLVIFPQGTRVNIGEKKEFYSGVYFFYKMDLPIVPVALNTGKFWPNNSFFRYPGTIIVKFLEPIVEKNLSKKEFMKKLSNIIENESEKLL